MSRTFQPRAIYQALPTGLLSCHFYFLGSQDNQFSPMGSGEHYQPPSPASLGSSFLFPRLFLRPVSSMKTQSLFPTTVCSLVT